MTLTLMALAVSLIWLWRRGYFQSRDMYLKPDGESMKGIRAEAQLEDLAREQTEVPRGRRQKVTASEPIGRYREFQG